MAKVYPYYFPTTIMFVDDDLMFLRSLRVGLFDQLASIIFDSPAAALAHIDNLRGRPTAQEKFLTIYHDFPDGVDRSLTDRVVAIELSRIPDGIYDASRFEELSVVVVDYAMPGMNGLEFCRAIGDFPVYKILLTGRADEKTAVDAFNAGIIDRFIVKSDPDAIKILQDNITNFQQRHFDATATMMMQTLAGQMPQFLRDPAFAQLFDEIRNRCQTVEYYLAPDAAGFLLLDADGAATFFRALTAEDLRAQWEIARDQDGPDELLEILKAGTMVPNFWATEGFYAPSCTNWQDFLAPAEKFSGQTTYYYALISDPPGLDVDRILSFEDYLEQTLADDQA